MINKTILHNDLEKHLMMGTFNALRPKSFFESNKGVQLNDYLMFEVISEGVNSHRTEEFFGQKLLDFKRLNIDFLEHNQKNSFLIWIEHGAENKSRLRSYKGGLDKSKIGNSFIQIEQSVTEITSLFMTIIKLDELNDYLFELFLDDSNCFIINSPFNLLSKETLERVLDNCQVDYSVLSISYLDLMGEFCLNDQFIQKLGGDSGEEYWSLQFLMRKEDFERNVTKNNWFCKIG